MNIKTGLKLLAAAALATMLPLTTIAQDLPYEGADPAVIAAAKEEGVLNLYLVLKQVPLDRLVARFQEVMPELDVRVLHLLSGPMANRFTEETEAGMYTADVFSVTVPQIFADHPDWWASLSGEVAPNLAGKEESIYGGNHMRVEESALGFAYNTQGVGDVVLPTSWEDLIKPEFKGKGLMTDPRATNTYMSWLDLMYDTYGPEYIEKLGQQDFTIINGGAQGSQEIAAGADRWFVFPVSYGHAKPLVDAGAPLAVVYPHDTSDITATGSVTYWGLPANAPHPNAAKAFLNWAITPEAQRIICDGAAASFLLPTDDQGQCIPANTEFRDTGVTVPEDRQKVLLGLLGLE